MGYATIIHNLVQQRGVRALYQGFTPGLVNNSMTQALGFCFYEVCGDDVWRGDVWR